MDFFCLLVLVPFALVWAAIWQHRQIRGLAQGLRSLERRLDALAQRAPERAVEPPALPPEEVAAPEDAMRPPSPPPVLPPLPASPAEPGWGSREPAPPPPADASARPGGTDLPARGIEWERWIGVRGAAVIGGIVLALAAILFFQHAFTRGWISPRLRVGSGLLAGVACLLAASRLRRKGFDFAPSALDGAGIVTFYAAAWYARLVGLVGPALAFGWMAAVTVLALLLSHWRRSQLTAVLALAGGFATPLLIDADADRPISLFGYLLLLDLGLLFAGRKQAWPWLTLAALLATLAFEATWVLGRMGEERGALGLAILAVFAVLFLVAASRLSDTQRRTARASAALAVSFSLLLGIEFATSMEFAGRLAPIALYLALLGTAACWLERRGSQPFLALGSACGTLGVVAAWLFSQSRFGLRQGWELSIVCVALALMHHLFAESEARAGKASTLRTAAWIFASGCLGLLMLADLCANVALIDGVPSDPLWPWLAGSLALAALLLRQAARFRSGFQAVLACLALAFGLVLHAWEHGSPRISPIATPRLLMGIAVLVGLGLWLLAVRLRKRDHGRPVVWGALGFCALVALGWPLGGDSDALLVQYALFAAALGLLACTAATLLASSLGYALAALAVLRCHAELLLQHLFSTKAAPDSLLLAIVLGGALIWLWPALSARYWSGRPWVWRAGVIAGLGWYAFVQLLRDEHPGPPENWNVPFVFGALALAGALLVGRGGLASEAGAEVRLRPYVRYVGLALFWFCLGIAWKIDHHVPAVVFGLTALALSFLARRHDQRGPLVVAVVLSCYATLYLLAASVSPHGHPAESAKLLNWLSYSHLVPGLALLGAASLAGRALPAPGLRWHSTLRSAVALMGLCGLLVIFLWINLEILNAYAHGEPLTWRLDRYPQRDLMTSIAWLLYSLVLLGFGMARRSSALRWASLALLLLTLAKVFLYDLGEIEGLYRVASLFGLALSLLLVSLLYQRFVFRRAP